ncbi:Mrp/NBP35 family ATP-binding protein [Ruminococcaceae bacterium OttesenSCG-928-A16]|nr:Mrp/NBP35 family ATP-binding protein [Ruminococcaceae bacterium OttesenSCG-928-A16]
MSENCSGSCAGCEVECDSRTENTPADFYEAPHPKSKIKKVVGVVSGKGGVGKSLTSALLAVLLNRRGLRAGILDADITGPSIPKLFGIKEKARANADGILPAVTKTGIQLMSVNLLLENETDPVVWRGPVIGGTVKQFWSEVVWDDLDFLLIDMPPGTGDVPLTVFQSIPLDGIVVVTSPQELVNVIVSKAVNMAGLMNIPVLGLVENMSYLQCPDCERRIEPFGKSHAKEIAGEFGVPLLAQIPIDPALANAADHGVIELFEGDWMDHATDVVEELLEK